MAIFNSYVSLPEGTKSEKSWFLNTETLKKKKIMVPKELILIVMIAVVKQELGS